MKKEKKIKMACWVDFIFAFSIFLFIPYEIYMGNASEFNFDLREFIAPILVAGIVFVLLFIIHLLLKGKVFEIFTSIVFSLTISCYIQSMILNGMLQKLDGTQNVFDRKEKIINLLIWIIIFLINIVGVYYKKKIWGDIYKWGGIIIFGAQIVALMTLLLTYQAPKRELRITTRGLYEISKDNNVIIFCLDKFDQKYVESTLEKFPYALNGLEGFTYYPNATGKYCYTHISVPYLLTGNWIPEYDPTYEQHCKRFDESEYFNCITDNVGNIGIYTSEYCLWGENARAKVDNCMILEYVVKQSQMSKACIYSALYRASPFAMKHFFEYSAEDFNKAIVVVGEDKEFNNVGHKIDAEIIEHLKSEGLTVNKEYGDSAFRFIHLNGTHLPYELNEHGEYSDVETSVEQCAVGEFKLIEAYCDELERLGLFEKATIIITADHGLGYVLQVDSPEERNANPILFYKPAGIGREEEIKTSLAPTGHDDIFKTVLDAYGMASSEYEYSIDEITEEMDRIRYFYWCWQDPEITDYESCIHIEYAIQGDARDNNSWMETGKYIYPNNNPKHEDKQ